MKNYEKYADEIRECGGSYFCEDFIISNILKSDNCSGMDCCKCRVLQTRWLMEEYEEPKEPEVDWSKVAVDTPILVRRSDNEEWAKRYFARYRDDGYIYAWSNGCTSWTAYNSSDVIEWEYAKLVDEEESDE